MLQFEPLHKSNILNVGCARLVPVCTTSLAQQLLPEAVPARAKLGAWDNPHEQGQSLRVFCSSQMGFFISSLYPESGWDRTSPLPAAHKVPLAVTGTLGTSEGWEGSGSL